MIPALLRQAEKEKTKEEASRGKGSANHSPGKHRELRLLFALHTALHAARPSRHLGLNSSNIQIPVFSHPLTLALSVTSSLQSQSESTRFCCHLRVFCCSASLLASLLLTLPALCAHQPALLTSKLPSSPGPVDCCSLHITLGILRSLSTRGFLYIKPHLVTGSRQEVA